MLYESLRSSFALLYFGRVGHLVPLRLAGDLGRRRRREWVWCVRNTIAHTLMSLVVAGEVCIADDDHIFELGIFVGQQQGCCRF